MKKNKVFIIAEAGVNHNGSLQLAKKMIDAAGLAGADAVKFQTFTAERLATRSSPKAVYQKKGASPAESQFEMLRKLELDAGAHKDLKNYCSKKRIAFMSSPFDIESIELLKGLGLGTFKVPSGEITDLPYLRKIGSLGKKVILSTGMSTLVEVRRALDILTKAGTPKGHITVMHCSTAYPTLPEDVNLLAMVTLRETLGVRVGYSDHTRGIEVPIAATALGASVIEKHFTLDRTMKGPDHGSSLEPAELAAMVRAIRNVERALGNGIKRPARSEEGNSKVVRKSIVSAGSIKKGETFTAENITVKRAGPGVSPMLWDRVIGKTAMKHYQKNELIKI